VQKLNPTIDISNLPDLLRLVEEVQASGQPRVLTRGDQQVAVLSPVSAPDNPLAASEASPTLPEAPSDPDEDLRAARALFGNFIGIGNSAGSPDDPTDVSENKHKYLADAYDLNKQGQQ
jgi:antitoxin (DNA-binding transcriptional repressor) of toxin-antitoxin stability system